MKIPEWLLFVTNNQSTSRHEMGFDVFFFFVNTIAVIVGAAIFLRVGEPQWIPFLVIEYTWALDTMRHNRP